MDNTKLADIERSINRILNGIAVIRFPVLHRPDINNFTAAQHDHTSASNGGTLGTGALGAGVAGAGLTISSGVLAVGQGNGLAVNADDVGLQAPGTLTVISTNVATNSHTHAITSSSTPGNAAVIMATDDEGVIAPIEIRTQQFFALNNIDLGAIHAANAGTITMYLKEVSVAPTSVTNGGVLYVESGALKWLGSGGTVTTIAAA